MPSNVKTPSFATHNKPPEPHVETWVLYYSNYPRVPPPNLLGDTPATENQIKFRIFPPRTAAVSPALLDFTVLVFPTPPSVPKTNPCPLMSITSILVHSQVGWITCYPRNLFVMPGFPACREARITEVRLTPTDNAGDQSAGLVICYTPVFRGISNNRILPDSPFSGNP